MDIRQEKLVPPVRIYRLVGVSNQYGNKVLSQLETEGRIRPRFAAGRRTLSFDESEILAKALTK